MFSGKLGHIIIKHDIVRLLTYSEEQGEAPEKESTIRYFGIMFLSKICHKN